MSASAWIGEKGRWVEDNSHCEIIGVIDEGAGIYEFRYVEPIPEDVDHDLLTWVGFIDDWMWEDNEC